MYLCSYKKWQITPKSHFKIYTMSFESLGLNKSLLKAVEKQGYKIPSPIQEKAIPLILDGKELEKRLVLLYQCYRF